LAGLSVVRRASPSGQPKCCEKGQSIWQALWGLLDKNRMQKIHTRIFCSDGTYVELSPAMLFI